MAQVETNCIYRSITLTAGETFVLPPGAEVISVSDSAAVSSSCGELPVAETKCYKISWVENVDPEGGIRMVVAGLPVAPVIPSNDNAWEQGDHNGGTITFTFIGGMGSTTDTGGINYNDLSSLENVIASSPLSGALFTRKYGRTEFRNGQITPSFPDVNGGVLNSAWNSGYNTYTLYFQSVESIAKTIYLEAVSTTGNIGDLPRYFAVEIDCEEYPTESVVQSCEDTVVVNPNDPITTTITTAGV